MTVKWPILTNIIVLFLTTCIYAQQWATDGTVWTYEKREAFAPTIEPVHFFVGGDTTINGRNFKIIRADLDGFYFLPGDDTVAFTYEENGKAYLFDYTRDTTTVLYDFDAQVGESWIVSWDTCTQTITVDSMDLINVNGTLRKRLHVRGYYQYDGAIIEGIGLVNQLFSPEWFFYSCDPGIIYDGEYIWGLRCFDQPGMAIWNTGLRNDCDVVLGMESVKPNSVLISPNPFSDHISLQLPLLGGWDIEVYSINGQLVTTNEVLSSHTTIQSSQWESGIYLIRVIGEEGDYWTQKIIKK